MNVHVARARRGCRLDRLRGTGLGVGSSQGNERGIDLEATGMRPLQYGLATAPGIRVC